MISGAVWGCWYIQIRTTKHSRFPKCDKARIHFGEKYSTYFYWSLLTLFYQ